MEIKIIEAGIENLEKLTDLRAEFIKDDHPELSAQKQEEIRKAVETYLEKWHKKSGQDKQLLLNSSYDSISPDPESN